MFLVVHIAVKSRMSVANGAYSIVSVGGNDGVAQSVCLESEIFYGESSMDVSHNIYYSHWHAIA